VARRKSFAYPVLLTDHVFDKVRAIDLTLAEFEALLDTGEIIEEHALSSEEVKEVVLLLEWLRPLHVVVVVDHLRREERILTLYEPDSDRWTADFRSRR
jgi:hypothetical protein